MDNAVIHPTPWVGILCPLDQQERAVWSSGIDSSTCGSEVIKLEMNQWIGFVYYDTALNFEFNWTLTVWTRSVPTFVNFEFRPTDWMRLSLWQKSKFLVGQHLHEDDFATRGLRDLLEAESSCSDWFESWSGISSCMTETFVSVFNIYIYNVTRTNCFCGRLDVRKFCNSLMFL